MWKIWTTAYHALVLLLGLGVLTIAITVAVTAIIIKKPRCNEKIIIDTDAGVDDAVAILLLLNIQKHLKQCPYEVAAITCTYGNTNEKQVEMNVKKTLTIAYRADIPIYAGATRSLLREYKDENCFGSDGLGDTKFDHEILGKVDRSMHASQAMIELSKKYEGKLSMLILGPTTNVALAGSLDRGFFDRVKHFYVMGSSVAGVGNAGLGVEFNFAADPEANFVLLNSTNGSKLTIFPWETTLNSGYTNNWRKNALKGHDSKTVRFLNDIESTMWNESSYHPCDALAATVMVMGDKFVKKSFVTKMEAVVDGAARGSVLVDYAETSKQLNVKIIQLVDIELYKSMFICACTNKCSEFWQY